MENNKKKKTVKFQGDMLNFCDFIQVFVFTRNHHLKYKVQMTLKMQFQKLVFIRAKREKIMFTSVGHRRRKVLNIWGAWRGAGGKV